MTVSDQNEIPQRLEDLTPDWLTGVLRERGHLQGGHVSAVKLESIGDGVGFMGVIGRLGLSYEGDSEGAPDSLIAKLPTTVRENRGIWRDCGASTSTPCSADRAVMGGADLAPRYRFFAESPR